MPQSPSYRRDFDSQKRLLQEDLYRLYGPDCADADTSEMQWAEETLARLKAKPRELGYSEQDEADLKKVGYVLERRKAIATFFNPNHGPDGRFASGLNVSAAIDHLRKNALEPTPENKPKLGHCAQKVSAALKEGGVVLNDYPNSAKDYGKPLLDAGFVDVGHAEDRQGFPPDKTYKPAAGDVVVIQPTTTSPHGHMAMFDGKQWISDFKQRDFWPGPKYREQEPSYVIYRSRALR